MAIDIAIEKQFQNSLVLANASELVTNVIRRIAGNDISNSLNGSTATAEVVQTLAAQSIGKALLEKNKVA